MFARAFVGLFAAIELQTGFRQLHLGQHEFGGFVFREIEIGASLHPDAEHDQLVGQAVVGAQVFWRPVLKVFDLLKDALEHQLAELLDQFFDPRRAVAFELLPFRGSHLVRGQEAHEFGGHFL